MTMPHERYRAIARTEDFLRKLMRDYSVSDEIKDEAYWCLRHYPTTHTLDRLSAVAPDILQPTVMTQQVEKELDELDSIAYREAAQLATALFKKHFANDEHYASGKVVWELCGSTAGVISQIDNMVSTLVRPKIV